MLTGRTILLDCRWLGFTGIGRATELLLRALAHDPPPGRWVLWARSTIVDPVWPEAEQVVDTADPRRLGGLLGVTRRPSHDVAVYVPQLRPFGRRPSVQFLHDAIPVKTEPQPVRRALKRAYFRALGRASVVLVPSRQAAEDLCHLVGIANSRLRTYEYPADARLQADVAAVRATTGSHPEILFVGRVAPHKNLERLIEAHLASAWRRVGGTLILAGPGTESFARSDASIAALGTITEPELVRRLARARALVLPSLVEGFGLPVLEAQAAGLPVLASDRSPMRELLVPGHDVAFDPEDVDAIRDALDVVARDEVPRPGQREIQGATPRAYRDAVVRAVVDALRT